MKQLQLIEKESFHQFLKTENQHLAPFSNVLMYLLQLNKVNSFYSEALAYPEKNFTDYIFEKLNITIDVSEKDLENIPLTGSFISVSNHPFGGIDGLILIHILLKKCPDFKVIANFLLKKIEPLSPFILPVNPFEERKERSYSGLKAAIQTINNQQPLGIFPSGEVSSLQLNKSIVDNPWNESAIKLIKKANVPVVPIYFEGNNSITFHLLGLINPKLRTAKLASEVFNKKNKTLRIKIGKPISVENQNECNTIKELSNYLRNRTYALNYNKLEKVSTKFYTKKLMETLPIAPEIEPSIIKDEIQKLNKNTLLFENGVFQIYCAPASKIPNVIQEIGRLREITFREVGEGTGKAIDLDYYDNYYYHLFMWDKEAHKIAGAYRIGMGAEIIATHSKKGFYINSLFKLKKELLPKLKNAIELGRSFITKDYQKQAQPLFLLWKGILYFLIKNPDYRYLIGPVSISNDFSSISKNLMIEFIKQCYFDSEIAQYVVPRKAYKIKIKDTNIKELVSFAKKDISKLDKMIVDFEPDKIRIPVLIKKYIKLNAKIVGFNVDPNFNNTLDGLIFLDLLEVPQLTINQLAKDFNDDKIIDLFYNKRKSSL